MKTYCRQWCLINIYVGNKKKNVTFKVNCCGQGAEKKLSAPKVCGGAGNGKG